MHVSTRKEERAIGKIEEMLLDGLPLTHSTEPENLNTIQNSAIKPAKVLPEGKANSLTRCLLMSR